MSDAAPANNNPYPTVDPRQDFPALERRILQIWDEQATFRRSIDERDGADEFVFYDGPPFANGLPHYGHLLTGYIKDVVPRYQTMPEKQLKVSGRRQITEFGIDNFNEHCRTSVMRYTDEWQRYVNRQARWVDFDNDYKTMDLSYMESVIWAFKQLWDKGLVYEDYKVLPYSWGAETVLSNHEIRLDDATRPRQDPAVTVAFSLDPAPGDPGPLRIWAWTTTPWTLPSNLALAVGPDIDYALVEFGDGYAILAEAMLDKYAREIGEANVHSTIKGAELVERTYQPLLPYFADNPNSFRVLGAEFVEIGDGTGVVHMAPGFGEDDKVVGDAHDVPLVVPVDDEGRFTAPVSDWEGLNVFDANPQIIEHLKGLDRIIRHETYDHNYPHCWRTGTPIIYRATTSWFIEVTRFRDRMVELNQQINWVPNHIRDGRFGKWLEGAHDWPVSRNRFWGSPLPIWRSDDPDYPRVDCYGSLDELEADFGVRPTDLHRPYIDDLVRPNPDDPTGKSMMRRVPEVLDCWFDSGSMPYAQVHYPFENKEWFEEHFPADWIVEYINQTRGWFFTLHILSTALFDRPPFLNAIGHGILNAEDGQKLSKSLRNYPDPEAVMESHGSDALRWYLMAAPIVRGGDMRLSEAEISDVVRLVINPIWNAYSFFTLYANADNMRAEFDTSSPQLLDRYILAKTRDLVEATTASLDSYDLPGACADINGFLDALNNWYIRRSRDRFWAPMRADEAAATNGTDASDGDDAASDPNFDKQCAYNTLYTVLVTLSKVAAPMLPMITEEIHRGLTGDASVHLSDWPVAEELPANPDLVAAMDRARDVVSTALKLRLDSNINVRVPLASMTVAGQDASALGDFVELIRDEVNVKTIDMSDDLESFATFVLRPDGKVLGPKLGGDVKAVFAAAKSGDWELLDDGRARVAGHELDADTFELALLPRDDADQATSASGGLSTNDGVVLIDTNLTPELLAEGTARTFVRLVQNRRRELDLVVTDRVQVHVAAGPHTEALTTHKDWVSAQVLATSMSFADEADASWATEDLDGEAVSFLVEVAG